MKLIGVSNARPDYVPGQPRRREYPDIPTNQINIAAFRPPANGTFGNPAGACSVSPAGFGKTLGVINTVGGFSSNLQIQFALRYSF